MDFYAIWSGLPTWAALTAICVVAGVFIAITARMKLDAAVMRQQAAGPGIRRG